MIGVIQLTNETKGETFYGRIYRLPSGSTTPYAAPINRRFKMIALPMETQQFEIGDVISDGKYRYAIEMIVELYDVTGEITHHIEASLVRIE